MAKEKTNIEHLTALLYEIKENKYAANDHAKKVDEAIEFAESIDEEIDDLNDSVSNKKTEIRDLESRIDELEDAESDDKTSEEHFVGLDTVYVGYQHGNLRIMEQVEGFMNKLKNENCIQT